MGAPLPGGAVERLIEEDIEAIAQSFQIMFQSLIDRVEKPNVLVAGTTGAGKSSIVNAIFGSSVTEVGHGVPVTSHFMRIEPPDKAVVIYDSRGLEDGFHEEFIADTRQFFDSMREKPHLKDQIHVIWYVINCASGRFEPFEVKLIREIFAPTPVIFILNKADVASAEQLNLLENLISSHNFENSKGVFRTVADRQNYSQNWCPKCYGDDVMFRKKANKLLCESCQHVEVITPRFNLGGVVERTTILLPQLAKEVFLFSQVECLQQRDIHAKELVHQYATSINMDVSGEALEHVGEMVGRIFVLWGWNFLGLKVKNSLVHEMKEEYKGQDLSVRLAMVAADTILKRKLSRSVIACLGVLVNRPLRELSEQLLSMVERESSICVEEFDLSTDSPEQFTQKFMDYALEFGISNALNQYWYESF
mmetsp:Transcript_23475/g.40131  ORF Transcript_23475/g.40131 Transcript_23475/m.40131 type:complete len:421 (-) Transcript_23475:16-1278(-)